MNPDWPEAARAFVESDVALLPTALADSEITELVDHLVAGNDAARLQKLADSPDRRLAKPARRGLHVLRTRGQSLPKPEKREFRLHGPYVAETLQPGMVSFIDGHGERIVWLVRPAPESFNVYQAELSETRGLIGFQTGTVPKKEWRHHSEDVIADRRRMVVGAPHEHVRWLIEEAYLRTAAAGRTPPEDFARARLDLGPVEKWQRPELPPPDEPHFAELHQLPEVALWVPPEDAMQSLDLELGQITTSQLVVSAADRSEQIARVIDKLLGTITVEFRALLAERLEETALIVATRGLHEEARQCVAAARLTRDATASSNPFLRQLFEKLIKPEENP